MNDASANSTELWPIIRGILLFLFAGGFSVWACIRALKASEEPKVLLIKWLLTVPILVIMFWKLVPMVAGGGVSGPFAGIMLTTIFGLFLAIIWRRSVAETIATPFVNLYTGGGVEVDPAPFYSAARARRNRGKYYQAILLIREQLEKFPKDFEGQFLIAEIQAEDMNDVAAAAQTIGHLCEQEGHTPQSIAFAFNSLADWHLKYLRNADLARADLEQIIARFPDSEQAARASQRIGRLADTEQLLADREKTFQLPIGPRDLGLRGAESQPKAPSADAAREAAELVDHLVAHPLDTEAREKLALIYAHHYQRLDLATDQLEQLIGHPNQPVKRIVHWLNLLADLQVRYLDDDEPARATLQRIVEYFPNTGAAQMALSRMDYLKLGVKGKEKTPGVKLGNYEQDIGLKGIKAPWER